MIGYQRSLLIGAVVMSAGLFLIVVPNDQVFKIGLATIIAGNGLFKPNVSTMVGQLYPLNDPRRDSGFTIFYMGINAGGFVAPILTGLLADKLFGTEAMPAYKYVFIASGIGMLISLVWFWLGRRQLGPVGLPPVGGEGMGRTLVVLVGTVVAVPVAYGLLLIGASILGWILTILFLALCGLILFEGIREGKVQRDRAVAMLIVFVFNVMFSCSSSRRAVRSISSPRTSWSATWAAGCSRWAGFNRSIRWQFWCLARSSYGSGSR